MTPYEIPLSSAAQSFTLAMGGVSYILTFRWNVASNCWILDIADTNQNPVITGIPVITGLDLLDQYSYLNFGGMLIVQTDYMPDAVPTYANLGTTGRVYFVTFP